MSVGAASWPQSRTKNRAAKHLHLSGRRLARTRQQGVSLFAHECLEGLGPSTAKGLDRLADLVGDGSRIQAGVPESSPELRQMFDRMGIVAALKRIPTPLL